MDFSSHDRSSRLRDTLKLDDRVLAGIIRWMISGKYPSDVENDEYGFFLLEDKLSVRLFSSRATRNPRIEIIRAVVFRYHGIVRTGILVGGIL